jgi:hypothetical protein
MSGTESLIAYVPLLEGSGLDEVQEWDLSIRSFRWLGLTLWWTAYVPLLGGSGLDVVQKGCSDDWDRVFDRLPTYLFWRIRSKRSSNVEPIQWSFKWLGPSLWWTAYVPLLGGSGPDVIQKLLEDTWSTNVMTETSDQVCMVISKWAYSREIFKMSWIFLLKLCGVETFLCNVVFLLVLRKIIFFLFSNEQKVVPSNRSFGWSWHSIAKPFSFIRKD